MAAPICLWRHREAFAVRASLGLPIAAGCSPPGSGKRRRPRRGRSSRCRSPRWSSFTQSITFRAKERW